MVISVRTSGLRPPSLPALAARPSTLQVLTRIRTCDARAPLQPAAEPTMSDVFAPNQSDVLAQHITTLKRCARQVFDVEGPRLMIARHTAGAGGGGDRRLACSQADSAPDVAKPLPRTGGVKHN